MIIIKDSLTLGMILWNEGENCYRAIEPLLPILDEVVIGIDEKTKDDTEEEINRIRENYSEEYPNIRWDVFKYKWEKDFSAARNLVLDRCNSDWIFFPDGHEIIRPDGVDAMKQILQTSPEDVWMISPFIHMDLDQEGIPASVFPRPIFWRNHLGIKWQNPVHNVIDCPDKFKRLSSEINLVHEAADKHFEERNPQRSDMNIGVLKERVEDNKDDTRSWFYLGNTYAHDGDLDKAVEAYKKYLELPVNPDEKCQVWLTLAAININRGEYIEARNDCFESIKLRWDRAEGYFFLALASQNLGSIQEALHWYHTCAGMTMPITAFFLRGDIYTFLPYQGLVECYNAVGEHKKALEAAEVVLKYRPNDPDMMYNYQKLRVAVDKEDEAAKEGVQIRFGEDKLKLHNNMPRLQKIRTVRKEDANIYKVKK